MRGWNFFPSSHKYLAPGGVRGWNFFPILSRRFGARWSERIEFFFPSSHKDLAPGGVREWIFFPSPHEDLVPGEDTHGPECHKPQIGVPKMDTWQRCDDLSLARPDP